MRSLGIDQLLIYGLLGLMLVRLLVSWAKRAAAAQQRELVDADEPVLEAAWPTPAEPRSTEAMPQRRVAPKKSSTRAARPAVGPRLHAAAAARALRDGGPAALRQAFVWRTILDRPLGER